jgi:SAM-dependent methyltransferase
MNTLNKEHWENVYQTKTSDQVSWTQEIPKTALEFIASLNVSKDATIIDIGGGDGNLVDYLLAEGYTNLSVLDISGKALERAKARLGEDASKVNWIECNILDFKPTLQYEVWHDRATFHFLTSLEDKQKYIELVNEAVTKNLIVATFSDNGPLKCSGLEISQYNEDSLTSIFDSGFQKEKCILEDHQTPFDTLQNFIYCTFTKK